MTREEYVKQQLDELVSEHKELQDLSNQIKKVFLGCKNYITRKRIKELETIGFTLQKVYCKKKKQKDNLKKVSGTIELNENSLIIYLSCKKYDIHYLLKEL